ncbi:23S rRNA (adenine(2030)-N(6))-methyltransferase RlmJ [Ignatzschineria larvae DSM 13226]|uniref:Ribosomal RNA large subunit methyltransferase J n=1 Tax=Ignatzschineria larvae DSM 13226 TaxID=1111732 RepID=A0ABZ3C1X2_9GAMM|nr:23S rRNA (adenine(2030)-N(6))-methyltransferase RlmJ [Ignatzschineria larvae]
MLSYRHSFHAGNHADVLKHTVQSLIIESLTEKEKAFLYLDTHSGAGRYQLTSAESEKTGEYLEGIARIWATSERPEILAPYLDVVKKLNSDGELRYYPGSPLLAKALLRSQDQLIMTELHPSDYPRLVEEFARDRRAEVLKEDGFQQLKSKLPPTSRRGFVLIDPPYELKTDYEAVVSGIVEGYKRFATGIYAIWYPVVSRTQINNMVEALRETGIRKILQIELGVQPDSEERGMTASGMIVINPPWKLEAQIQAIMPWLYQTLVPDNQGHTLIEWITPE